MTKTIHQTNHESTNEARNNRILVVSGGGCRGAWGAGFVQQLINKNGGKLYDVAFGTSTGSLMNPLILLGDFDRLKQAYTNVSQQDIFDINPFNKKFSLGLLNTIWRLIICKATFGESNNLHKLIDKFFKPEDYEALRSQGKMFGVGVVDFKTGDKELKCSDEIPSFEEMKNWVWASCNQPLFMTYFPSKKYSNPNTDGHFYVDGGVRDTVPVSDALHYAMEHPEIRHIDVIVNQPKYPIFDRNYQPKRIYDSLLRLIEIWRTEVVDNDIMEAKGITPFSETDTIHIWPHYFPHYLFVKYPADLRFDSTEMQEMWEEGIKGNEDESGPKFRPSEIVVNRSSLNGYFDDFRNYRQKFIDLYEKKKEEEERKKEEQKRKGTVTVLWNKMLSKKKN